MKQGYITVQPMIHHEQVGWRHEDGSPVFHDTKEEAQRECDLDFEERLEYDADLTEEDKDFVAWCVQTTDTTYSVYEDESCLCPLFVHDLNDL